MKLKKLTNTDIALALISRTAMFKTLGDAKSKKEVETLLQELTQRLGKAIFGVEAVKVENYYQAEVSFEDGTSTILK